MHNSLPSKLRNGSLRSPTSLNDGTVAALQLFLNQTSLGIAGAQRQSRFLEVVGEVKGDVLVLKRDRSAN